jgi:hypothetical protein
MIRTLATALAAAALAFVPLAASADISPGTELVGNFDQSLSSKDVVVGQRFTISNVHSQDNNITGATIYGHVDGVQSAGQGRPGQISLAYDQLRTRSGGRYALNGRTTAVQENTKNNTVNEAGGAVAGMIIGNILGKKLGTNAGGLLGAAGGYIYAKNAKQNVTIPQSSVVTVQVIRAARQGTTSRSNSLRSSTACRARGRGPGHPRSSSASPAVISAARSATPTTRSSSSHRSATSSRACAPKAARARW